MINCFNRWFFVVCAQIVVGLSAVDLNDTPEDVLNYIDSVQKKLNVAQNSNIILVVGNTGCGKSTLVHYVAGDYSRIIAIEPLNPNSVNFDIRDELDSERDRPILATESRTLIPVISTDENHNVWMDCPGFGDTRNETVEIATAFLIKRVIENASHIKIVLVSSYDSIINSRDDFDNLLTRSAQLMNNVTRFENSISLVVTKAPPFKIRGRRYIDIFEDNIKNTTANFMIDHHSVLKTKRAAHNKMQLIESLLGRNTPTNEYYPKISVFWRPNEAGPFNKIEKMIAGRRSIRESIINHSSYTPVRMTDFGLPLTPQAQIKVSNLRQHTVNSIKAILQHNIDRLIFVIQNLIQSARTVKIRLEIINVGQSFFQTNIHGSKEITLDQLADKLGWLIREYNVSTTDVEELHRISRYGENLLIFSSLIATDGDASDNLINLDYYSYLQQVNEFLITKDNDIRNGIVKKTQEMKLQISKILVNSDEQLLQALHKKIESTNGFQNRLQILETGKRSIPSNGEVRTVKERIDQLKKLTYAFEIPSINVTALNYVNRYEKSLTELKSLVDEEFRLPIRDWIATSSKAIDYQLLMYDWYSFLEETYRYFSDPVVARRDRYVSINETNFGPITKRIRRNAIFEATPGRIIEINKIRNIIMKTPATYECEGETLTIKGRLIRTSAIQNALVTKCDTPQDLTMVKVFVLDTLYVDSDLYLNQPKEMELQIMAPKWNIQKHAKFYLNGLDAENYNQSANEGSGGMHGEPGSNGGNFFGWANIVTNSEWLSVDLSGGRGANGQNGAGSRDGVVELNETGFSDSGFTFGSKPPIDHIRSYFIRNRYNPQAISEAGGGITSFNGYSIGLNVTHTFALQPECCGRTGAGGIGGFGGAGGSGHFICSSGKIDNIPKIILNSGNNGGTGKDGKQCKNLELIVSVATEIDNNLVRRNMRSKFYNKHHRHFKGCPLHSMKFYPGKPNPTRKRLRESINFVPSLIEYNLYLLRNINDPDDNVAQSTYEIINSDPAINSAYTINDLATEANTLERNYSELSKYIDVLPLYDNMLKKIERFAVNNEGKLSRDDQNVLSLIYTMISSKTTGMRSSHTSDLIVNIKSFLDLTAQNVKKLNELKRMDVITVQRDEYKNELSAKIQEAKNFIENDINPEIRRTISLLNDELQKAVDDTIELRSRILYEINAKEEQLRILRRNVNARNILSIFELIGGITEVICESIPSKIFGGMMKFVSQISKTDFVVDPKISNKHDVPQSIQRLRNTMHTMGQEKIESTENELQILKKSLQENNVTNHTFTDHLDKFIFNANSIKMSSSSLVMHDVNGFLKICIKFLRGWQDAFESERKASIQRPIQRALYALTVVATSFPTYKRIYSDDDKITEVIQALNQDSETLEVLRKFEEGIYSDLMLMVDEMYEYVTNVGENLFKKSSVALDVTSWNVQRTIRNVQNKLIDKISQFDIESNTNECMIRINKAMELLIDIYDRIQSYERESKLITYLSNLHITSYSDIHDSKSKEMLNEMEENLQMNSVLGQYFRVFGAFKQVIFPYASDYLSAFEIPSSLIVSNTSTSTALVSQQIETLSEKLKEYNDTVINEHDKRIHPTTFGRDQGSTGPFYTWSNFEIRDRIQQLFTEKRIYLLADVHKSDTRNAVKFNKIELGFHINNLTLNHQLQEVLQSFHVSLTHMGNSNYRCNNTFYTIPSQPVDIKYSIGKRNGKPVDRNLVYDKLAASPSLLSPYTLWSVQLSRGQFNKLQRFVDFIDIELYGEGLYLEEDAPICKTNLEKYYSVMSQIF